MPQCSPRPGRIVIRFQCTSFSFKYCFFLAANFATKGATGPFSQKRGNGTSLPFVSRPIFSPPFLEGTSPLSLKISSFFSLSPSVCSWSPLFIPRSGCFFFSFDLLCTLETMCKPFPPREKPYPPSSNFFFCFRIFAPCGDEVPS